MHKSNHFVEGGPSREHGLLDASIKKRITKKKRRIVPVAPEYSRFTSHPRSHEACPQTQAPPPYPRRPPPQLSRRSLMLIALCICYVALLLCICHVALLLYFSMLLCRSSRWCCVVIYSGMPNLRTNINKRSMTTRPINSCVPFNMFNEWVNKSSLRSSHIHVFIIRSCVNQSNAVAARNNGAGRRKRPPNGITPACRARPTAVTTTAVTTSAVTTSAVKTSAVKTSAVTTSAARSACARARQYCHAPPGNPHPHPPPTRASD